MQKVSVIIPVYNAYPYIATSLDSVLRQTFDDIEVLCVNDGSSDGSHEILADYAGRDSRIRIINLEKNLGSGPARNRGIEEAKGAFCTFCDADDIYPPRALETLYNAAVNANAPASAGNIAFMDHTLSRIVAEGDAVASIRFYESGVVAPRQYYPLWLPLYHPRYMVATDFLRKYEIRYPQLLRGQDPPFLAHVLCHAGKVAVRPEVVYLCRCTKPGITKTDRPGAFADYMRHISIGYSIYMKHGATREACLFLGQAIGEMLSLRKWLSLTCSQRIKVLEHIIPLVEDAGENLFEYDYAPYPIDGGRINADIALVKKGQYHYIFIKILHKLRIEAVKIAGCFKTARKQYNP